MTTPPPESDSDHCDLPVSEAWLVDLLNSVCGAHGRLLGSDCSVVGKGKGFVSVCTRVKLAWEPRSEGIENLPRSVVLKIPSMAGMKAIDSGNDWEEVLGDDSLRRAHNTEVDAYDFFSKYSPLPIPMARLYYSEKMTKMGTGMLILEDLSDLGMSVNLHDNATPEQAMTLAEHIANLQAFGLKNPDWLDSFRAKDGKVAAHLLGDVDAMIGKVFKTFPELASHISPLELKTKYEIASKKYKMYKDPQVANQPSFLTLGDVQPNNIFWQKTAEGLPSNNVTAFLDLQGAERGYCMSDIGNYAYLAMSVGLRREMEDKMIEKYFAIMKMANIESGGGFNLTMEDVKRNFRSVIFVTPLVTYPILVPAFEVLGIPKSFRQEMFERLVSFTEDAPLD